MVTNSFRNRNFLQSMKASASLTRGVWFFSFWGAGEGGNFFLSSFLGVLPCHQPRSKMVTNSYANKSSMQPMKGSAWTHEGSSYFLCGKWGKNFLLLSLVPIMFPMCSCKVLPRVPNLFPQTFPIAPHFFPIWFAQSWSLRYINWKGGL